MGILHKNACSMRWTHLEPRGIPEDRGELLHHLFAIANLTCSANEHVATFIQGFDGFFIQGFRHIYSLGRKVLIIVYSILHGSGINPEVPMVLRFRTWNGHSEGHLRRFLHIRQWHRDLAQFNIAANRESAGGETPRGKRNV